MYKNWVPFAHKTSMQPESSHLESIKWGGPRSLMLGVKSGKQSYHVTGIDLYYVSKLKSVN